MRIEHIHSLSPALQDLLERAVGKGSGDAAKLDAIDKKLDKLIQQGDTEQMDLTKIADSVKKNTDAIASAKTVLGGVADQIRQNATDQTALNALADQLDTDDAGLAAAIAANTPAAPPAAA